MAWIRDRVAGPSRSSARCAGERSVAGGEGVDHRVVRPDLVDLVGHQRSERVERGLVRRAQAVEHQPERDRAAPRRRPAPRTRAPGAAARPGPSVASRARTVARSASASTAARGGQLGDLRADEQPGLEDAARHRHVELAVADQQPGQQVEAAGAAEVPHGGGVALADVDQAGLREPLQRLADRGAGDAEHLGEPAFAGQRLPGAESRRRSPRRRAARRRRRGPERRWMGWSGMAPP